MSHQSLQCNPEDAVIHRRILSKPSMKGIMLNKVCQGFPGGSVVKNSLGNAEDVGRIPGSGRSPGKGNGSPLYYSCLGEFHGQRSLAGYSPWGSQRVRHN